MALDMSNWESIFVVKRSEVNVTGNENGCLWFSCTF